jgi:beta-galactosidase
VNLALETDNPSLRSDRTDTAVVTVEAVDQKNKLVPWDANRVDFKISGPARLLGYENGDPTDVTPNQAPFRQMFYGMERGFFQATAQTGAIEVAAAAILGEQSLGYEGNSPRLVAIAVQRTALRGALEPTKFEIRYTTNGSVPTESSQIYSGPFPIQQETVVRALILRDQKTFMQIDAHFRKVDPTLVSDPRWTTNSQVDPVTRND